MYRKAVLIVGFIAIFGTSAVRIPTLSDLPGSFNAVVTTITDGTIGKSTGHNLQTAQRWDNALFVVVS